MERHWDVIVAGAGLAGLAAAATAAGPTSGAGTGSTGGPTPSTGEARAAVCSNGSA